MEVFPMNASNEMLPRNLITILVAGINLVAGAACGDVAEEEETDDVASVQSSLYATASDSTIAQAFRPRFKFGSTECWPLTFQEISSTASSSERDGLKSKCKGSYDSNFVVFASVKHPSGVYASYWDDESFRVTYGVAFGKQNSSINTVDEAILDLFTDTGEHGEDKQYATVDVVGGAVSSVWADLHAGSYTRVKSQLTMHSADRVTVWPGKYYHAFNLVTDRTSVCDGSFDDALEAVCSVSCLFGSSCGGGYDEVTNFGDDVGDSYQGDGKLVMVDDVCAATGTSYTSPDGITYSGTQLDALKAFIGCDGSSTAGVWDGYLKSKAQYSSPYSLKGCDSGNTAGGDICNGSVFGSSDTWTTFSGSNRYIEPTVVGNADVDYSAGSAFNDMLSAFKAPSSITIRTGSRVDAVSVTYTDGKVKSHGGTGGSAHTISGLDTDPVVSVYMCEGSKDGAERAGHIKLTTLSGRTLSGGSGSSNCKTIAPSNKKLYGFYGRSGSEMDVLGTYWGNR
jgi:hypothetical protein